MVRRGGADTIGTKGKRDRTFRHRIGVSSRSSRGDLKPGSPHRRGVWMTNVYWHVRVSLMKKTESVEVMEQ